MPETQHAKFNDREMRLVKKPLATAVLAIKPYPPSTE
jgi:hypothetical protein